MQYTLGEIPPTVDTELRRRAKVEGKSLNTMAIEALTRGAGLSETPLRQRDLGDIAGTWQAGGSGVRPGDRGARSDR